MAVVRHKAAIHSGHFMISDFEPDEQDEDEVVKPAEEVSANISAPDVVKKDDETGTGFYPDPQKILLNFPGSTETSRDKEIPLTSLFKSMSIAYRQKLTSPKWNRFRGLKLRWKDKIRMNNVIWRCWHMQFMKNEPRPLCAFANPLEIDNHNRTEGSTILEGKYWKRKLDTIKLQYNQWRRFHRGQPSHDNGRQFFDNSDLAFAADWEPNLSLSRDDVDLQAMLNDEGMIVDLLLNTLQESTQGDSELGAFFAATSTSSSVAVPFPNPRDFYRTTTNADLVQPGLGSLQPNLDDMGLDLEWLSNANNSQPCASQAKSLPATANNVGHQQPAAANYLPYAAGSNETAMAGGYGQPVGNFMQPTVRPVRHQPYPMPVQSAARKPCSPKQRLLQHREHPQHYNQYDGANGSSELVHLLKLPKSSPSTAVNLTVGPTDLSARRHSDSSSAHSIRSHNKLSSNEAPMLRSDSSNARLPPYNTLPSTGLFSQVGSNSMLMPSTNTASAAQARQQRPVQLRIPPPKPTDYQQFPSGPNRQSSSFPAQRNQTGADSMGCSGKKTAKGVDPNRRGSSIKHSFEDLRQLIPSLRDVPASSHKISKAALLHKGADYLGQIKCERIVLEGEAALLRERIENLDQEVSSLQGSLPASGRSNSLSGKLMQQRISEDKDRLAVMFDDHVYKATAINWKYWIYSRLVKALFESYSESVAGVAAWNEIERATKFWLEDKCNLVTIRQSVISAMKLVSVDTKILSEPEKMPQEVVELALKCKKEISSPK